MDKISRNREIEALIKSGIEVSPEAKALAYHHYGIFDKMKTKKA
ncbi:hypothetical protein [Clostridium sediminicola]